MSIVVADIVVTGSKLKPVEREVQIIGLSQCSKKLLSMTHLIPDFDSATRKRSICRQIKTGLKTPPFLTPLIATK